MLAERKKPKQEEIDEATGAIDEANEVLGDIDQASLIADSEAPDALLESLHLAHGRISVALVNLGGKPCGGGRPC
jgi:hypothetical protein